MMPEAEPEITAGLDRAGLSALAPVERVDRPRRANPAEKKAVAYRKDHRIWAKDPHLDRRSRPKKKALRNQTYRRQVDRSLRPALGIVEPEIAEFSPARPLRRKSSGRSGWRGAIALGEWIERRRSKRLWLTGRKLLGNFHRERHRKRLAPFVETLIQGRSEHSRLLARSFALVLDWPPGMSYAAWRQSRRSQGAIDCYAWRGALDGLFKEQPELEARFRAWIADLTVADDDSGPPSTS